MPDLTDEQIIEMYARGASLREIAGVIGRSIRRPLRLVKKAEFCAAVTVTNS